MAMLNIEDEHKIHLKLLKGQPQQVIVNLCKLASNFMQNGINSKKYTAEAQKLQVSIDIITHCVFGLVYLLLLSSKNKLSEEDFKNLLTVEGFLDEEIYVLQQFYQFKNSEIQQLHSFNNSNEVQHYHDLQWRVEVKLGSRSSLQLQNVSAIATIQLSFKTPPSVGNSKVEIKKKLLQVNVVNLVYIVNELELALKESKSRNSRKLQKIFKALQ